MRHFTPPEVLHLMVPHGGNRELTRWTRFRRGRQHRPTGCARCGSVFPVHICGGRPR